MSEKTEQASEKELVIIPPASSKKVSKTDLAVSHAAKIEVYLLGSETLKDKGGRDYLQPRFIGVEGYNPYLYIAQVINPVLAKIKANSITDEELDKFLKIPVDTKPDGKALDTSSIGLREHIESSRDKKG
jgi:hypothetical protein